MKDLEAIRPSAIVDLVSPHSRLIHPLQPSFERSPPSVHRLTMSPRVLSSARAVSALMRRQELTSPPSLQIYSGEAMAASLNYRGRRAGGDPDPNERANAPPKKGITKPSKKGAKQVQRSSTSLSSPNQVVELMPRTECREMLEVSIIVVTTTVSGLYAVGESEQGSCET